MSHLGHLRSFLADFAQAHLLVAFHLLLDYRVLGFSVTEGDPGLQLTRVEVTILDVRSKAPTCHD